MTIFASAGAAAAGSSMLALVFIVIIVGILLFFAPLGIWWRLIKAHNDMNANARALERNIAKIESDSARQTALLNQAVKILRDIAEGGYADDEQQEA